MNVGEFKAENSIKILEKKLIRKIKYKKKKEKVGTMRFGHHTNNIFPLLMLLLMSCVIIENDVDNP